MSDDKFTPKGEDEIKAEVIEKHGLDVETQGDLIDSLTADNLESQKNLGTAIRQKGEWRDKATANKPPEGTLPEGGEKPDATPKPPEGDKLNKPSEDRNIREVASDVNALTGESDEVVDAMEMVSKSKGITLSEAKKDPTIVALKEKADRDTKSAEAALPASGRAGSKTTPDYVENESKEDHKKKWEAANKG